jgi:hypothetical protein
MTNKGKTLLIDSASAGSFRFGIRTMLAVFVVVGLLLVGVRFVIGVLQVPRNAYATWDGACLVIDHMRRNNNEWPKDWKELGATLSIGGGVTRNGLTIEDLRQRLLIDFDVKSENLTRATIVNGRPDFRVIRLRNSNDTHWEHAEPNTLVYALVSQRFPVA